MLIFKAMYMGSLVSVAECSFSYMDEVTSSSGLVGFFPSVYIGQLFEKAYLHTKQI